MKEYIDSMKDSRNPFSGETYLLPKELGNKYAEAEALEIEYLSSKQSGLVHPDDLAEIKAEAIAAKMAYRQALLEKMSEYIHELSRNNSERIDFLVRDFQSKEDTQDQPLYADVQIRWNEDGRLDDEIIKLVPDRDEEFMFYNADGLDGLKRLMKPDNGQDFTVEKVYQLYGRQYEIAVVDYLTRDVDIAAGSEKEALKMLDKQYSNAGITLGRDDFSRRDVVLLENCLYRPEEVRLIAAPENNYHFTIQEILQHVEKVDAGDLEEAIGEVERRLKENKIIVGSGDDYSETHYITHARLVDNSLKLPTEIPLADIADFQKRLKETHPEGMTVHLQKESVEHLRQFPADINLNGLVNAPGEEQLSAYGALRAEVRLKAEDFYHVFPDEKTYYHEKLAKAYDNGVAASTMYIQKHPDMDGGRVNILLGPQIMKNIRIEDMPLSEALHAIEDRNIRTDQEFLRFRNEIKNKDRISETSLYKNSQGNTLIRCKIDGRQQSARQLSREDLASYEKGSMSRNELAAKAFSEELTQSMNREENRGMKR